MVRLLTDAPRVHRCWLRRRINTAVRRGGHTVICSAVCVANRSLRSPLHDGGSRTSPTWYPHLRRWNRCYWVDSQLTSKCTLFGKKNSVDARSQGEPELLNDRPACSAVPEPGSVTRWIGAYRTGQTTDARLVWDRYFVRLRGLARRIFGQASLPRIVADEEDAVVGAFAAFAPDSPRRSPGVAGRHELSRLLRHITKCHTLKLGQRERRGKRGGDRLVAKADLPGAKPDWPLSTSSQLQEREPESAYSCTQRRLRGFWTCCRTKNCGRSPSGSARVIPSRRLPSEPGARRAWSGSDSP